MIPTELTVTHILAFIHLLFMTAKLMSTSFSLFVYVMINQLGLFALSVQVDKSSLSHAPCPLALCNADRDAFCGVHTKMLQQIISSKRNVGYLQV